jgi:predicted NUDIX family phosphoesterase
MPDKMDEMILVVDTAWLRGLGSFNGLDFEKHKILMGSLDKSNCRFVRRGDAENNEDLKQLIPYVIVAHAGKILYYVRGKKSGESRLKAKGSIGIGGHINMGDGQQDYGISLVYLKAMHREINEELNIPGGYSHSTVCLLNDDSNSVGRVHLGIVHVIRTNDDRVSFAEPDVITEVGWKTVDELRNTVDIENWSAMCVSRIDEILSRSQDASG